MLLSVTGFLTTVLISSLLILLLCSQLKSNKCYRQIGISAILFVFISAILRLLLPIEFVFSYTIASKNLLPQIVNFFNIQLFSYKTLGINLFQFLLFSWCLGILLYGTRILFAYIRFKQKIKEQAVPINNNKIKDILIQIVHTYKKSINFKILQTSLVATPMLIGIKNPMIVIPDINLTKNEWGFILAHEVSHYYHHDLYVKLLIEFFCIIYWWNPLIYILRKQINKTLEIRIDLSITKDFEEKEKIHYLECLLNIVKIHSKREHFVLTFGSYNTSTLLQRFHMLLDDTPKKSAHSKLMFATVLVLLFLSYTIVFEPYSINEIDETNTFELNSNNAYILYNSKSENEKKYDIYYNHQYLTSVSIIGVPYSALPIYNNIEEEINHEKQEQKVINITGTFGSK